MIRFDQGNRRFNYRIVGVAIHDNAVLLHRADHETFWTLPGGRAEHGETAEQTITREMLEELEGLSYHELAMYFLIRFPSGSIPLQAEAFDRSEAGMPLRFRWFPVRTKELVALPLLPGFLPHGLVDLPQSVVHIVQHDVAPGRVDSPP
jgi:8-oxo-dGTP pyrophosphatase MutT (NUDIX family)